VKHEKLKEMEYISIGSPLTGNIVPLSEVEDAAFSQMMLGKGAAIEPTIGKVVAPVDGILTTLFKTKHAIGIEAANGVDILVHIGLDTINLEGKYFKAKVKQGDKIKVGQTLIEFDLKGIKKAGYSLVTPVIITNTDDYADVIETDQRTVNFGDVLIKILRGDVL